MTNYTLTLNYQGECTDISIITEVVLGSTSQTQYTATFTELEEFSDYLFNITAVNQAGASPPVTLTATTLPTAPSGQVKNLVVSFSNSTFITIQWDRVDCIERNSVITGYVVNYGIGSLSVVVIVSGTNMREYTFSNLIPRTQYTFQVVPISNNGNGPSQAILVTTDSSTGVCSVFM